MLRNEERSRSRSQSAANEATLKSSVLNTDTKSKNYANNDDLKTDFASVGAQALGVDYSGNSNQRNIPTKTVGQQRLREI